MFTKEQQETLGLGRVAGPGRAGDKSPAFGVASGTEAPIGRLSWQLEAHPNLCPALCPATAAVPGGSWGRWVLSRQPGVLSKAANDEPFEEVRREFLIYLLIVHQYVADDISRKKNLTFGGSVFLL